eukprot:IDg2377t1
MTTNTPATSEFKFIQTFHVPRGTYEYFREAVLLADSGFFGDTVDALGVPSCITDQKACSALLQLVGSVSCSALSPYLKIGSSTAALCRKKFCATIVRQLKSECCTILQNKSSRKF